MDQGSRRVLGMRNRTTDEEAWAVYDRIETLVSRAQLDALETRTLAELRRVTHGHTCALAWSGGKDSLVLYELADQAGITQGVCGLTRDLEYPAMEQWLAAYTPQGITLWRRPIDYAWLLTHQDWLFPRTADQRGPQMIWQVAQDEYCAARGCDLLLLGRRRLDENFVGRDGSGLYLARGVWRYNPLRDWTHEEVLASLHYHRIALPPLYGWYNGFTEGTHPWPRRGHTRDDADAWAQLASIDASIVEEAARRDLRGARAYLAHPTPIKTQGPRLRWPRQRQDATQEAAP